MPRTPSSNLFIAEIVAENEEETDEAGEAGEDDTLDIPSAQPPSSRASHRVAKRKVQSSAESDRQRPAKRAKSSNGSKQASSHATKRKPSGKQILAGRAISRTYDHCNAADKRLIDMREAGDSWKDIRAMWERDTGEKTAVSTLPNRYERLKSNFAVIKQEDHNRLIEAKHEVEALQRDAKWDLIAKGIVKRGGDQYSDDVLQRVYKKLMLKDGTVPPSEIKDSDFDIDVNMEESQ